MRGNGLERARSVVERIVEELAEGATVSVNDSPEEIRIGIDTREAGLVIGRRGTTIDAIQHLAFRAARIAGEERRVIVDASGYRERREETLRRMAERAAREAVRFGRAVELEPMRAAERKVVHEHLRGVGSVETRSEGQEPDRRVVVEPTGARRKVSAKRRRSRP